MSTKLTWENTNKVFKLIKDKLNSLTVFSSAIGNKSASVGNNSKHIISGTSSVALGSAAIMEGSASVALGGRSTKIPVNKISDGVYKTDTTQTELTIDYYVYICKNIPLYDDDSNIIGTIISAEKTSDLFVIFNVETDIDIKNIIFTMSYTKANYSVNGHAAHIDSSSNYFLGDGYCNIAEDGYCSAMFGRYNIMKEAYQSLLIGYNNKLQGHSSFIGGITNKIERSSRSSSITLMFGAYNYAYNPNCCCAIGESNNIAGTSNIALGGYRQVYGSNSISIGAVGMRDYWDSNNFTVNDEFNKITVYYDSPYHYRRFSDFIGCKIYENATSFRVINSVEYDSENLTDKQLYGNNVTFVLDKPFNNKPNSIYIYLNRTQSDAINLGNNLASSRTYILGEYNITRGWRSTGLGIENEIIGGESAVVGYQSTCVGSRSILCGHYLKSLNDQEAAYGFTNISHTGTDNKDITKISIGAGGYNAIEVMRNKDIYINGKIYLGAYGDESLTEDLQTILNNIKNNSNQNITYIKSTTNTTLLPNIQNIIEATSAITVTYPDGDYRGEKFTAQIDVKTGGSVTFANIKWENNTAPVLAVGKTYIIEIVNGYARYFEYTT